jgi:predicted ATPase
MIQRFHVENYKALKDVTLDLTPIHVLIGANDTGKTSILESMVALSRSAQHELAQAFLGRWEGLDLVWNRGEYDEVRFTADLGTFGSRYELACRFSAQGRAVKVVVERMIFQETGKAIELGSQGMPRTMMAAHLGVVVGASDEIRAACTLARPEIARACLHRWNPRWLALPVVLDKRRRLRIESSGFGLASCLDDILGVDRQRFAELERRFIDVFPQVRFIELRQERAFRGEVDDPQDRPVLTEADGKGIYFHLKKGLEIPASHASDGMLLVLAYMTLLYLPERPPMILLEEPENGVHPQRLREIVSIFKEIVASQNHTQVVLTTHSPMLIDLFSPEEVTLCQKNPDGSVGVRRLSESQTVREQMNVFTLGEIWAAEGDESLAKPGASAP